jgi:hypothetical protein
MKKNSLIIHFEFENKKLEKEIESGQTLFLGRSRDCDVVFESTRVSKKHLSLTWDGQTLRISALESHNGTFRGVEQLDFKAAEYIVTTGQLDLWLSDIPVSIQWKPKIVFIPKPEPQLIASSKIASTTVKNKNETRPTTFKECTFEYYFSLILVGVLFFEIIGTLYLGRKILFQGFNNFHNGALKDFYLYIVGFYKHQGTSLWLYFSTLLVISFFVARSLSEKRTRKNQPIRVLKPISFFVQLSVLVLPVLIATIVPLGTYFFSGFQIQPWNPEYSEFWRITRSISPQNVSPNYNEKLSDLRKLKTLEGSSLMYKEILALQRKRVLTECGGVGSAADWESKKTCLVLLAGIAAETLEDTKPALLATLSAQVVTLTALDGLVRTLAVEGVDTPTVLFFTSVLSELKLKNEVTEIEKILGNNDLSNQEKINALSVMRGSTELDVQNFQRLKNLPKSLSIVFPGPLESGI